MDITPLVPAGRQLIGSYGDLQFRINETVHSGSVIVFPSRTISWDVLSISDIDAASLMAMVGPQTGTQILIIGCGAKFVAPPAQLRQTLRHGGIVLEWMDTGAGCRTYNVLLTEDRPVAAALIAVE